MRPHRSRSRSYSPRPSRRTRTRTRTRTPPHYDEPRHRHRSPRRERHRSPLPTGLLVRNVALSTRPEELRVPFEKFGPVKDVYLPRDYYTGEPRGFGFVKFRHPEDAAEAKDRLNHAVIGGREIRIVYAEENRKTPHEMRKTGPTSSRYGGRRRSPPRSPRRRNRSYSRSPAIRRRDSRSVSRSPSSLSERDHILTKSRSPRCERRPTSSSPRSENPARISMSPRGKPPNEREYRRRVRSPSPRDISPHNGKRYKSTGSSHSSKELSPFNGEKRSSRRSPDLVEISARENSRSSGRFVSTKEEASGEGYDAKQDVPSLEDFSPHDEEHRSYRTSRSPREDAGHADNGGASRQNTSSPRNDLETGYRSKHRSVSPRENQLQERGPGLTSP